MNPKPIEAEVVEPTKALAVRQEAGAVGRPMTLEELHRNLEFVRQVMRQEMKEGQDFGQIPGCGPKPSLFQPGAQKLLMTFNLCEKVRKEEVKDHAGGHREYAFTICVQAVNGKEWDGVGTCTTLEAKYRYRQSGRRCPQCGQATILRSKKGAGYFCWAKKGGCGANFRGDDQRIVSQSEVRIEHDNPADFYNTVRKMAFKRALVAATINATNTSELWTQDIEEMSTTETPAEDGAPIPAPAAPRPAGRSPAKPPPPASAPTPKPAPNLPPVAPFPTPEYRQRMIASLKAGPGEPNRDIVTEYFKKLSYPAQLMPFEAVEDLPLRFVPATKDQMLALGSKITAFANGERAEPVFPPHPEPPTGKPAKAAEPAKTAPVEEADNEAWRRFPMPYGKNAGIALEDLDKKYLYGLWLNFTVETVYNGRPKKPETIAKDEAFRAMLNLAGKHYEFRVKA